MFRVAAMTFGWASEQEKMHAKPLIAEMFEVTKSGSCGTSRVQDDDIHTAGMFLQPSNNVKVEERQQGQRSLTTMKVHYIYIYITHCLHNDDQPQAGSEARQARCSPKRRNTA
jgi:uncharacterized protein YhfF